MYQPFDTGNILLVHDVMVREEMQRNDPRRHLYGRDGQRAGFVAHMRRLAGKGLIALGTRIDPSSIRADHPAPASA